MFRRGGHLDCWGRDGEAEAEYSHLLDLPEWH